MSDFMFDRYYTENPVEHFSRVFKSLWRDSAFGRLTATARIVLLAFTDKWAHWTIGD